MMERRCQLGVVFCPGGMGLISCAAWAPGFLLVGWNDDGRAFPPDSSMNRAARSQTGEEGATDPPPALSPRGRRSLVGATFASLAYRNFTYLWLGQVTHAGALWIDTVARPLLVLELSGGSAVHLGLVMAARTEAGGRVRVVRGSGGRQLQPPDRTAGYQERGVRARRRLCRARHRRLGRAVARLRILAHAGLHHGVRPAGSPRDDPQPRAAGARDQCHGTERQLDSDHADRRGRDGRWNHRGSAGWRWPSWP